MMRSESEMEVLFRERLRELREKRRRYHREYYRKNKERLLEYQRQWVKRKEKQDVMQKRERYVPKPEVKSPFSHTRGCRTTLKMHHEVLKDDPERLPTRFLAELCDCTCLKYHDVKKVKLTCPFCSHTWKYRGINKSCLCPKCKKRFNVEGRE